VPRTSLLKPLPHFYPLQPSHLLMPCMFSQAPREKGRPRPATLRGSAFSAFRKSFRQESAKTRQRKRFSEPSEKAPLGLGSGHLSRPPGVCPERSLRDHDGDQVMQAQTTVQNQFFDTITDQDFSDAVAVHEQDLIDAYALGSLTPEEARSIQTWIEASPRRMQRVGMARALLVRHPQKIRRNPWINDVRNDVSLSRMR
jgi:hypothetical protein